MWEEQKQNVVLVFFSLSYAEHKRSSWKGKVGLSQNSQLTVSLFLRAMRENTTEFTISHWEWRVFVFKVMASNCNECELALCRYCVSLNAYTILNTCKFCVSDKKSRDLILESQLKLVGIDDFSETFVWGLS